MTKIIRRLENLNGLLKDVEIGFRLVTDELEVENPLRKKIALLIDQLNKTGSDLFELTEKLMGY